MAGLPCQPLPSPHCYYSAIKKNPLWLHNISNSEVESGSEIRVTGVATQITSSHWHGSHAAAMKAIHPCYQHVQIPLSAHSILWQIPLSIINWSEWLEVMYSQVLSPLCTMHTAITHVLICSFAECIRIHKRLRSSNLNRLNHMSITVCNVQRGQNPNCSTALGVCVRAASVWGLQVWRLQVCEG